MAALYPSLIAADLLKLGQEILVLDPFVDGYHIDIMDNHFVPNLTWGLPFIDAFERATGKQLWIHLMVDNPLLWIEEMHVRPGSIISFHLESTKKIKECLVAIKEKKWHASLAINPKTPVAKTLPFLDLLDQILIMSVEPGFSGQDFKPEVSCKVPALVHERARQNLSFSIAMDGGVAHTNIAQLLAQGVQEFAVASAIFKNPDRVAAVHDLRLLMMK